MRYARMALIVFSLVFSWQANADGTRNDGNWWRKNASVTNLSYIVGFWGGRDEEVESWDATLIFARPKEFDENYMKLAGSIEKTAEEMRRSGANVTAGQLADGLNNFYADYKNRLVLVPRAICSLHKQLL